MKRSTPIITLVGMAAFGLVLLLVNQSRSPGTREGAAPATATATAEPAAPPAGSVPVEQKVYAGRTDGPKIAVAVAVKGDQAAAYLCDGKKIESWLSGTRSGDQVQLSGKGDARLTGTIADGTVTGTAWVGGKKWTFSAAAADAPAGLYEARGTVNGQANRIGWIVLPDGEQVGLRAVAGTPRPAPALTTGARSIDVDGVPLDVRAVDGTRASG